jgi:hypothetical protein
MLHAVHAVPSCHLGPRVPLQCTLQLHQLVNMTHAADGALQWMWKVHAVVGSMPACTMWYLLMAASSARLMWRWRAVANGPCGTVTRLVPPNLMRGNVAAPMCVLQTRSSAV